jgi:hypothetical protein
VSLKLVTLIYMWRYSPKKRTLICMWWYSPKKRTLIYLLIPSWQNFCDIILPVVLIQKWGNADWPISNRYPKGKQYKHSPRKCNNHAYLQLLQQPYYVWFWNIACVWRAFLWKLLHRNLHMQASPVFECFV